MKKMAILAIFVIFLFSLIIPESSAVTVDPAGILGSLGEQVKGFFEWYKPVSYETTEKGVKLPVLNPKYELGRRFVDFGLLLLILGTMAVKSPMKRQFGKPTMLFFAGIISLAFVATSKIGLLAGLFPLVSMMPFILVTAAISLAMTVWLGEKATPFVKILAIILAIGITFMIFNNFLVNLPYISGATKIPFIGQSGAMEPKYAQYISGISVKDTVEGAKKLDRETEDHLKKANDFFNQGNKAAALREINLAEQKNNELLSISP